MAGNPSIVATVKITAKDINGNNTAKQFNNTSQLNLDFQSGKVNIVDETGSFFFQFENYHITYVCCQE